MKIKQLQPYLPWISATFIRMVGITLRMTLVDKGNVLNNPDHPPVIIAFWHNEIALMAYFHWRYCRARKTLTFISRSRDGQFMTDVASQFGLRAIRGSSSKHGTAATLTALRSSNDPRVDIAITPDGPRGPRHHLQPGVLRLAQTTGRPIIAIRYELQWKRELKSWDRFHVALPLAACRLITSEPIYVPEEATEEEMQAIGERVSLELGGD